MKFAIQITEGPYNNQSADSAYHFIMAALKKGHTIVGIFLYHNGVLNVSNMAKPPGDDRDIQTRWSDLARNNGVDIVACTAASRRRGITEGGIVEGARIASLGQLADMIITADRLITFG